LKSINVMGGHFSAPMNKTMPRVYAQYNRVAR
jgi:hypothetical protein